MVGREREGKNGQWMGRIKEFIIFRIYGETKAVKWNRRERELSDRRREGRKREKRDCK